MAERADSRGRLLDTVLAGIEFGREEQYGRSMQEDGKTDLCVQVLGLLPSLYIALTY